MGPSPTYHPPEGEECETSVEHGLPLWAEPAVGYCSRRPRPSPMWGSRFVGAREVGPWVGEQKPLGKSPLQQTPVPSRPIYLPPGPLLPGHPPRRPATDALEERAHPAQPQGTGLRQTGRLQAHSPGAAGLPRNLPSIPHPNFIDMSRAFGTKISLRLCSYFFVSTIGHALLRRFPRNHGCQEPLIISYFFW